MLDAERTLIGSLMIQSQQVPDVAHRLIVSDFLNDRCRTAFQAILKLHSEGKSIDPVTVANAIKSFGIGWDSCALDLVEWMARQPGFGAAPTYAGIIVANATRRELALVGSAIMQLAENPAMEADDAVDSARSMLAKLEMPVGMIKDPTIEAAVLLSEPEEERADVIIPGIAYSTTRTMIVAPEGVGKSVLMRQMAIMTAYGIHPFRLDPIVARRVMLIDLENPRDILRSSIARIAKTADLARPTRAPIQIFSRPEGIDLRRRRDRMEVEEALRTHRPELVCIGPLYKTYARKARESDEEIAQQLQVIFDDLRTRYAFALIIENHAPKQQAGHRDLNPIGSSMWMRWPEIGIALGPKASSGPETLEVGRWRGDRFTTDWPIELQRSARYPFEGRWK